MKIIAKQKIGSMDRNFWRRLKMADRIQTMNIFNGMREEAVGRGLLSDKEIEKEISIARSNIKKQKELV
ncbi:MAG: hypothetical protein FWE23_11205 [Chitinivibrionia bacterium]|nr:hypothetical protein [Chitinivibrionia bacterium]